MKDHVCKFWHTDYECDEEDIVEYSWPPRCAECGRFMPYPWPKEDKE